MKKKKKKRGSCGLSSHGFQLLNRHTWIPMTAQPLISCGALGKSLTSLKFSLFISKMEVTIISTSITR